MSPAAAKQGDRVQAQDIHMIQPPAPATPTPIPHSFSGLLDGALSGEVKVEGKAASTVGSTATNTPAHIPQGGSFVNPPSNKGTITMGSATVRINGQAAARAGDTATTCND